MIKLTSVDKNIFEKYLIEKEKSLDKKLIYINIMNKNYIREDVLKSYQKWVREEKLKRILND